MRFQGLPTQRPAQSFGAGTWDVMVIRTGPEGHELWRTLIGGPGLDRTLIGEPGTGHSLP